MTVNTKERGQNDKHWSPKHYTDNQIWGELRCTGLHNSQHMMLVYLGCVYENICFITQIWNLKYVSTYIGACAYSVQFGFHYLFYSIHINKEVFCSVYKQKRLLEKWQMMWQGELLTNVWICSDFFTVL